MAPASWDGIGRPRTVLHVSREFGLISETFIVDALAEIEARGWAAWMATRKVHAGHPFVFPETNRILISTRPSWRRRTEDVVLARRLGERCEADWDTARISPHPSIVHAHFGWSAPDALPLSRRFEAPLVVTFHGSDVTVFPRIGRRQRLSPHVRGLSNKLDAVFPRLDGAIAVSRFIEGHLRRLGHDGPVDIIAAGVRLDQFPYRGALAPSADGEVRLLFVGRLVPRKGLDVLLRSLRHLRSADERVRLDVVGAGPERAELDRLARELGVSEIVRHHGGLPRDDVLQLMRRAHIQVMSSRTMPNGEAEGSPVVSKEALAVGVQLVATDNGGTRETIPPEQQGQIVPEEDPERLAAVIIELLEAPEDWPARARRGREWVEQEFDWSRLAERTTDLYERLMAAADARTHRNAPPRGS